MPRRGLHSKQQLEELIIAAATELIEAEGLDAASTRRIAVKIGYTHGTVHSHYENFGDLILKINAETLNQLYKSLDKVSSKSKSDEKAIYAIAHAYVDYGLKNNNRWKALYEFNYPREDGEDLPEWYDKHVKKNFALVESRISHFCSSPAQARISAQVLWSSLHGIAILALTGKLDTVKAKSTKKLVDYFVEIYLNGLKKAL